MDPKQEVKQEVEPDQVDTFIGQLIDLVTQAILHEDVKELGREMVKYRINLSQKILGEEEEHLDQAIKIRGFPESFRVGWNEWKKNGENKEKTSYDIFKNYMNETSADQTENQSEP
ncbi:hypothetical protein OS493_007802 [Desmophyllum pertusum]|uniref:Uncharacterized protein n=1 Tax=Desmophyllum pertusum TaxID=174260 RepID=A0A9W9YUN3_9CNID|nr:hypothetical protein OS493_007802 [Desmophyllum pertusum]